jgi:hypothetical protein
MPELEEDEEWEVEEIWGKETWEHDMYYLLWWKGWPLEYDQWVIDHDVHVLTLI